MAPVEPELTNSNTVPIALFSSQVLVIAGLTTTALYTIRRAWRTLPPSHNTRLQQVWRRRAVFVFSFLAVASLAVQTAFSVAWRVLSYQEWARQGDYETSNGIWTGWYGTGEEGVGVQLGNWMKDVDLVREANRYVVQSPRAFVWTHQLFTGLIIASIFMGIEGQRRNLPATTIASFVLLSQICGLSFAQNLFFVLMLFTPIPLYSVLPPRRGHLWTPKPVVYLVPALLSLVCLHLMPSVENELVIMFFRAGYFIVPLYLALAVQVVPSSWGMVHKDSHSAHRSLVNVFYFLGVFSLLLQFKQVVVALVDSTPSAHYSGLDYVKNLHRGGTRSASERVWTALTRLVAAVSNHPAISMASMDVVLSGVGLCLWAFVRGLNVDAMLDCSGLSFFSETKEAEEEAKERHVAFKDQLKPTVNSLTPSTSPAKRMRGRPKKNGNLSHSTATPSSTPLRRSTRRRAAEHESDSEDSFKPSQHVSTEIAKTEHDNGQGEDMVADGEAAALALGLSFIGGLGTASASVLGAEIAGR
ncbi:uncharacterized protein K441DRAFT_686237 [Cenococcum geophilum 1.58]|uniref:uncharacterized protein n=1 Tax=Cenococcum geophilum 1.58 TaxID=794803 RepID=UPI00358F6083|nr:hypothetical protein K441DRAFT_686237 [Cenococcum geophilum 1.58]